MSDRLDHKGMIEAQIQQAGRHARGCLELLNYHNPGVVIIERGEGRRVPPTLQHLLELYKHWNLGATIVALRSLEFGCLYETPVERLGIIAATWHEVCFHLANRVMYAAMHAVDPDYDGDFEMYKWDKFPADAAFPEAAAAWALQSEGVGGLITIDDLDWLETAVEQEQARLICGVRAANRGADKEDKKKDKRKKLPRNMNVVKLAQKVREARAMGECSLEEIALEFTGGDEKKAATLVRNLQPDRHGYLLDYHRGK